MSTEVFNAQYEGIPDTLVQWFRFRNSVVIATTEFTWICMQAKDAGGKMATRLVSQSTIDQLFEPIGSDTGRSKAQLTERGA